ncbi:MAG: hypothetical protein JSU86_16305 [Phycisphaerales bacterium]|nr:MAG: hypothetical protein JSU86_16305 [Phycisphaerales bacterium]
MSNTTSHGSTARWWLAVVVGLIVSMPLAWLLSYAALLPFYFGVFFFALFGLLIGSAMHRIASPGRPYGRVVLVAGTTVVVLVGWTASIVKEGRDFPMDMAVKAGNRTRDIGDRTISEYRALVAEEVRRFLRERYPPGGTIGYVRWVLTSGELKKGQIASVHRTLEPVQRGFTWAARVVLSIALFAFGIGSQTLPLRPDTGDTEQAVNEGEKATPT